LAEDGSEMDEERDDEEDGYELGSFGELDSGSRVGG
jgi:hypothetical protein